MRPSMPWTPVVGAAVLLWAGVAGAQDNGLMALDTNDDGTIGRQEALSAQVEAFHRMDRDGDGQITAEELEALQDKPAESLSRDVMRARRKARERWLGNLDRDESGSVSLDEYQAAMTPYFDRLDVNGDGVLDGEELRKAIEPAQSR